MKAVIMAGGKGSRIASVRSDIPKPMIPIAGKPVLEYQIEMLRKYGYTDVILCIGYMGEFIADYFKDGSGRSPVTGEIFGVHISYIHEKTPMGTAGALKLVKDQMEKEFLLINGDILFDIDLDIFYDYHMKKNALATLFTHPNTHPYDSALIDAKEDGIVIDWLHKEEKRSWHKNRVNAGIHILSPEIFNESEVIQVFDKQEKVDLDRDILKPLIKTGRIYAYDSPEYVKDMGTPERYIEAEVDVKKHIPEKKNLENEQKAVFLDRDGTINEYKGFLTDINDFKLIPGTAKAIKKFHELGYLVVVVTNQPVIARGDITVSELRNIHNKMETLLGQEGTFLDKIYYCPHHPDKGFPGEIKELKILCECRKPQPGMLLKAAKELHINLKKSWMVGDSEIDILTGINAGCNTARITGEKTVKDKLEFKNLIEFAGILENKSSRE